MAGYSGTPLWKKLGYRPGMSAYVDGAPSDYAALLTLPPEVSVTWLKKPGPAMQFVHFFVTSESKLRARLRACRRKLAPAGVIWVSWPKKSSGVATDVIEDTVRAVALPLGLVDIKVCAVDGVWSGLKLMIRKELR